VVSSAPTSLGGSWSPSDVIASPGSFSISEQFATTTGYGGPPLFPAIAIPVSEKRAFECPQDHVALLQRLIPKVRKILTVGWRGTEDHFLGLLRNHGPVTVVAVGESPDDAEQTIGRLRAVAMGITAHEPHAGFSATIGDRKLDRFLSA
jgi:hypothetical protein